MGSNADTLRIIMGDTFYHEWRWESGVTVTNKNVTAVALTAPARVTVPSHGLPAEWRAAITDVRGAYQINAKHNPPRDNEFVRVLKVDDDNIDLDGVSAMSFGAYQSGGALWYYPPKSLSGYAARMTIKDRVGGTVLLALVSPTNITVDDTLKVTSVTIEADVTELITWSTGVYDLELVSGDATPVVTKIAAGSVVVGTEVTT